MRGFGADDLAAARAELAQVTAERVNVRAQLSAAGAPSTAPPPVYVQAPAPQQAPPPASKVGAAALGVGLAALAAWKFGWWPFKKKGP